MSTVKISQLPIISAINANTSNTLFAGVDIPSGITGKMTAHVLAQGLYSNEVLNVGVNQQNLPNTIAQFSLSGESYIQTNLVNTNDDGTADIVVTANTGSGGTDSTNFIDMGYANKNYQPGVAYNDIGNAVNPLDGYLYVQGGAYANGGNLIVGTTTTNTSLKFIVGGGSASNVVATMTSQGISTNNLIIRGNTLTFGTSNTIGNTITYGTLQSYGNTIANGTTLLYGSFTSNGTSNLIGNVAIAGILTVNGIAINNANSIFNGPVNVTGNSLFNGPVNVTGNTTINGNINYTGLEIITPNYINLTTPSANLQLSNTQSFNILITNNSNGPYIKMPAHPVDGQICGFVNAGPNTVVFYSDVSNPTITPAFTGSPPPIGTPKKYVYYAANTQWLACP